MSGDPNFRLKAFAVISCVLGVFLVAFVTQRAWYWLRTRRRHDVDTSRMEPVIDFGLLGIGLIVIWMAVEALLLAVMTSHFNVQPQTRQKIAEIEVGRLDSETDQLNLLFYPVNRAGRRLAEARLPVLTSGDQMQLVVEVVQWRGAWSWLGEGGFYQFVSLGGFADDAGSREVTSLETRDVPRTAGATLFLQQPQNWEVRQELQEGEVYNVYIDPATNGLDVELNVEDESPVAE